MVISFLESWHVYHLGLIDSHIHIQIDGEGVGRETSKILFQHFFSFIIIIHTAVQSM